MIDPKILGYRISDRRHSAGLTQKQLASLMGVSCQAVSKWERGLAFPDPAFFDELADVLGMTVGELLTGNKELGKRESV